MKSEVLSFPGLGLELNIRRVAFYVSDTPIYWYGVIIAIAFLLGTVYVLRRVKEFGLDPDRVMDVIFGGVVLGLVGARLYFVAFNWDTYKNDLSLIFNLRLGGVAIYGAIIGAMIAAFLMCWWRKVRLLPCLDATLGGVILGQAIGRWGNFVNIEAFGCNTSMPWGMTSPSIARYLESNRAALEALHVSVNPAMPVHPTFFYESIWCLLGFFLIAWYTKRRRYDGEIALIYLGWYGLGRFFIEGLRTDSLLVGSIRVSQMVALLCVIASGAALVLIRSRIRREQSDDYLPLYVTTEEAKSVLDGSFYRYRDKKKEQEADEFVRNIQEAALEARKKCVESPVMKEPAPTEESGPPQESGEAKQAEAEAEAEAPEKSGDA